MSVDVTRRSRGQHPKLIPRWFRRVLLVLLLWLLLIAACTALSVVELRRAGAAAADARRSLTAADLGSDEPERHLDEIARHAGRARSLVRNPLVRPAHWLPVAGRQLRSIGALAAAGEELGTVGADAASRVRTLVDEAPTTPEGRVRLVGELADLLDGVHDDVAAIELGPDEALVGPLASRRAALAADLAEATDRLEGAGRSARAVRDLLQGPRRVLLLAANNAEMRAGSGTFLSAAVLTTDGGRFDLGETIRTSDLLLPGEGVPIEGDLAERWGFTGQNREWRNLGTSPRFDVTAALAARMWKARTEEDVDGVLAVDVAALAAILRATGPIEIEGLRLDGESVVDHLLHDQYDELGDDDTRTRAQAERREQLGRIAEAAVERLEAGDFDSRELARGLLEAAAGRHVLMWSANADEQQGWVDAGLAGQLHDDSMLVSVINRGGNKLDHFLRPEIELRSEPAGDRTAFTATVRLRNRAGRSEVPYVLGPAEGVEGDPGDYIGLVAVNVPGDARDLAFEGGPTVVAGPDGPTRVIAGQFVLPRGDEMTVTVRFTRPGRSGTIRVEPSARVPGNRWRLGDRSFTDRRPRSLVWTPTRQVTLR